MLVFKLKNILCGVCKERLWWDRDSAFWCENKNCAQFMKVSWNPLFKNKTV